MESVMALEEVIQVSYKSVQKKTRHCKGDSCLCWPSPQFFQGIQEFLSLIHGIILSQDVLQVETHMLCGAVF